MYLYSTGFKQINKQNKVYIKLFNKTIYRDLCGSSLGVILINTT